jgi:hypothetical protein
MNLAEERWAFRRPSFLIGRSSADVEGEQAQHDGPRQSKTADCIHRFIL